MNERERRVLMAAAVAAQGFRSELLAAIAELPLGEVFDALEALVGRQLLRVSPTGNGFDFRHDLIQEVVYDDLSPDRRRALHGRAAEALQAHVDGQQTPSSELIIELSQHWSRAQRWVPAIRYALLAGDHARESFAPREALTHYQRAAEITEREPDVLQSVERAGLLERLGRAHAELGELDAAVAHFEALRELARARFLIHYWRAERSRRSPTRITGDTTSRGPKQELRTHSPVRKNWATVACRPATW